MGNFQQYQQQFQKSTIVPKPPKCEKNQIIFKSQSQAKQVNSSLKQKFFIFGFSPIWRIQNQDFVKKNFIHAFSFIQVCQAKQLYLSNNQHSQIIKSIVQIKFPKLTILNLGGNKIMSLQFLSYLQSPKLISLTLNDNQIIQAKSLIKCNFANLLFLNLQDNFIQDFQVLSKLKLKQIYELRIILFSTLSFIEEAKTRERKRQSMEKNQVQWVAKLQPKQIQKIYMKGQQNFNSNDSLRNYDYILQPKQIRMIKKRFYCTFYSLKDFQEEDTRWM